MYTAFITPIRITFYEEDNSFAWVFVDYLIDSLFVIDIIITLNSAFYRSGNEFISSRKVVILNYLKTWFVLDILALFPFELVLPSDSTTSNYNYFKLSRIPRTYRLIRMARIFYMVRSFQHNKFLDKF